MRKPFDRILAALLLIFAIYPATAQGQVFNPYAPSASESDARTRRAWRERAVAHIGPVGRNFVETYGDEAVGACFACSKAMGTQLAEFHASGELKKLPRPGDLLRVVSVRDHGDDVARFAMQHVTELADVDSFDAYLCNPLEYALGLKALSAGAAEMRARRLTVQAAAPPPANPLASVDNRTLACLGGGIGLTALLFWKRRQKQTLLP